MVKPQLLELRLQLILMFDSHPYLENQERLAREKGEIDATFHREAKPLSENILDLRLVKKE